MPALAKNSNEDDEGRLLRPKIAKTGKSLKRHFLVGFYGLSPNSKAKHIKDQIGIDLWKTNGFYFVSWQNLSVTNKPTH